MANTQVKVRIARAQKDTDSAQDAREAEIIGVRKDAEVAQRLQLIMRSAAQSYLISIFPRTAGSNGVGFEPSGFIR